MKHYVFYTSGHEASMKIVEAETELEARGKLDKHESRVVEANLQGTVSELVDEHGILHPGDL